MSRAVLVVGVLGLLVGCARPPKPLAGDFPPLSVSDVQQGSRTGDRVRWGGTIVETRPGREQTCIEIVSLPLDRRARPRVTDQTYGRFEACAPGFYDPQLYAARREVTVVGTVEEIRAGKVGEYDYPFPRVAAESIFLWPERPLEVDAYPYGVGFYGGYYGWPGWYPYWGPYPYRPYWGGGYWGGYWGGFRPGGPMIHHR